MHAPLFYCIQNAPYVGLVLICACVIYISFPECDQVIANQFVVFHRVGTGVALSLRRMI